MSGRMNRLSKPISVVHMLLEIKNLTVHYGKSTAVRDVSIQVPEGEVMSIIGANGSGKSSLLRAMAGLTAFEKGEIRFQGERINGLPVNQIVKRGLILVPEGRQLFPYLSVLANLKLGASLRKDTDGIKRIFKVSSSCSLSSETASASTLEL